MSESKSFPSELSHEGLITSKSNPLLKRIRGLESRQAREAEHVCFVEGIRPVWEAYEAGARMEGLLIAPDLLTSPDALALVEQLRESGVPVAHLGPGAFKSVAERENPSGLAALVRTSLYSLDALEVGGRSVLVALEGVANPGNLGTIIRTVDAVGGAGVILVGDTTDPFHPTAVKASMGTVFGVPIARAPNSAKLFEWCTRKRITAVTTSAHARLEFDSVVYPRPALFLFGSEGDGLSDETLKRGLAVRIPMNGRASSLNLAVAAGVLLYQALLQDDRWRAREPALHRDSDTV